MAWDRSQGVNPKYRSREHKRYRDALVAKLKAEGYLVCTARVCIMPNRRIVEANGRRPNGLHLGHADNGVDYAGPQHAACNVKDGARRGRQRQVSTILRW
jgi:hypothetical protein